MKKQILFLLIICSTICSVHAQTYTPINNYGQKHQRIIVDKNFKVPVSATRTRNTNNTTAGDLQLYIGATDTFLMVHTGNRWERLIDSTMAQKYLFNKTIVSNAATLDLTISYTDYIFSGTATTWTLPPISTYKNVRFYIKNRGSASITLNSNTGGNEIYYTSLVNTITITPGSAYMLINDGTYWNVE